MIALEVEKDLSVTINKAVCAKNCEQDLEIIVDRGFKRV